MALSFWFIWKKGYRTLTKNKSKSLPILILMALSIGLGAVMMDLQAVRGGIVEDAIDITNFADGFVDLNSVNSSIIENKLDSISDDYFTEYELRMILLVKFEFEGDEEIYDGYLLGIDTSIESHINTLVDLKKK